MKKLLAVGSALVLGAVSSFASITPPTPDYTDFEAVVGVALGVTIVVMLARKAKSFLSR